MNLNEYILTQRLYFDNEYEEIAGKFCNLAGQEKTKTKDRYLLPAWYDGYIYTALLGLKVGYREEYIKKVDKTANWSHSYLKQYKYLLMKLISRRDVMKEIGIVNREDINAQFRGTKNTLEELKKICDKYSNGGLKYLKELHDKDESIFDGHRSLIEIYNNASEE